MNTKERAHQALIEHAGQSDERSSLFWYLFEHHDQIMAAAGGRRLRWQLLCGDFLTLGLTDARGQAPSPETARQTWKRVRREVARQMRERLTGVPARKRQPRDLPRTTAPIVASSPQSGTVSPAPGAAGGEPPAPGGSFARIRQLMQGR